MSAVRALRTPRGFRVGRSSRATLRLPEMRCDRGRRAALSALFWRTMLTDNQMIPLGGRYTRIIRALNSSLWYLPKLIQLILTLGKREYLDYLALYKCKHPCSETIYFNWFGAGRPVDISSVRQGDVMLNGWGFDCPANSVAAWDLADRGAAGVGCWLLLFALVGLMGRI